MTSYLTLEEGATVRAADGTEIGTVRHVLADSSADIFDGLVIDTDDGHRFVDAPEVARITRARVTLSIDAAEAAKLPEHRGMMGSVQTRAGRTRRRWLRRFGR